MIDYKEAMDYIKVAKKIYGVDSYSYMEFGVDKKYNSVFGKYPNSLQIYQIFNNYCSIGRVFDYNHAIIPTILLTSIMRS